MSSSYLCLVSRLDVQWTKGALTLSGRHLGPKSSERVIEGAAMGMFVVRNGYTYKSNMKCVFAGGGGRGRVRPADREPHSVTVLRTFIPTALFPAHPSCIQMMS